MYRSRGLLFPLVLIAIGAMVLLVNTGAVSSEALLRLGDLWPLLLVILGLQLILNHTLPRQQATLIGLGATVLIVIAAVAYAALAPGSTFGTRQANFSDRVGGLTAATLDLGYNGATVAIQAGSLGDSLYQAHVDYPGSDDPPTISLDHESGTLEIREGSSFAPLHLFGAARRHVAISLSDRIPWTIKVSGGTANAHLDLGRLQLAKLEISGGASRLDARLPSPKGTVLIDISGGVSNLTLRAPAGAAWHVAVSGGISGLRINGSFYAAVGGDFQQQSPGYAAASDRFDIEISGGASHVDVRTG
ncbi:MAG: hypothetical protein M3077_14065 [Candidatus Dormibacteraeota bacterium]|nr:hypothetical protein [Candidatus Dormibacteraeota bacterium]MDQ6885339.1 hypothetical protein [Candidatus Dormibacteraeota bacterium]